MIIAVSLEKVVAFNQNLSEKAVDSVQAAQETVRKLLSNNSTAFRFTFAAL